MASGPPGGRARPAGPRGRWGRAGTGDVLADERPRCGARTWGTPSTAWWVISWRQIHSRRSSRRQAPLVAERVDVGHDDEQLVARAGGGSAGRTARTTGGPGGRPCDPAVMASIIGCMACSIGPSMAVNWSSAPGRGRDRRQPRPRRRRWRRATPRASRAAGGSRRACAAPTPPRLTGSTVSRPPGRRRRQAGHVGDVQLGHPRQLLERDALEGVDVGLAGAVGGDRLGQAAGRVPRHRAPALAQHLGQVAEQGEPLEGVGRAGVTHADNATGGHCPANRAPSPVGTGRRSEGRPAR